MLYSYDFSPEKISLLINKNLDFRGDEGIKRDAEIIYFYLTQKYGITAISKVFKEISNLTALSSVEIDEIMLRLANNN